MMFLSAVSFPGSPHRKSNCSEGQVSIQIDYNELRYAEAAAEILWRHDGSEPGQGWRLMVDVDPNNHWR